MNWRAITSSLAQACLSVYSTARQVVNEVREAVSPQGFQRSYVAVRDASLSYWRDLQAHPINFLNPLTVSLAPAEIFMRMRPSDQERVLIQGGVLGSPVLLLGTLPLSPILAGMGTYLSREESHAVEGKEMITRSVRQMLPLVSEERLLISPAGVPSLKNFRAGN